MDLKRVIACRCQNVVHVRVTLVAAASLQVLVDEDCWSVAASSDGDAGGSAVNESRVVGVAPFLASIELEHKTVFPSLIPILMLHYHVNEGSKHVSICCLDDQKQKLVRIPQWLQMTIHRRHVEAISTGVEKQVWLSHSSCLGQHHPQSSKVILIENHGWVVLW